jgi:hypothetical protein
MMRRSATRALAVADHRRTRGPNRGRTADQDSKRGLRVDALEAVNSGRAVDLMGRKAGAATIVSAIFLFGLGHGRPLRGQRRHRCFDDRSHDQRIVGWAGCPSGKDRPGGCPSHRVRGFFVLHNALPHCNMVGRICAEHPIERP